VFCQFKKNLNKSIYPSKSDSAELVAGCGSVFYGSFVLKSIKPSVINIDGFVKSRRIVMPVPDQVRDDGSGIQNPSILLDSGFRRNDGNAEELTFYEFINIQCSMLDVQNLAAKNLRRLNAIL
jgi:hypothetical protein